MRLPIEQSDLHYPEMEAEAKTVILKGNQQYTTSAGKPFSQIGHEKLAKILLDYLDQTNLLSEVFYQLYDQSSGGIGLSVGMHFFKFLSYEQIQGLAKNYVGANILQHFASRFLNMESKTTKVLEPIVKISARNLYAKIQPHLVLSEYFLNKPFAGDIVPNYSGISDRFSFDHDGIHICSPKEGGNVVTIESLQGIVIRQFIQEIASEGTVKYNLYAANVVLKNGMVVVYKDLLTVAPKLKKLMQGKQYWVRGRVPKPTSNLVVSTGELIGTIRSWGKSDPENKSDIGLHLTFLRSMNDLASYTDKIQQSESLRAKDKDFFVKRDLGLFVFPCGSESPVRCLK